MVAATLVRASRSSHSRMSAPTLSLEGLTIGRLFNSATLRAISALASRSPMPRGSVSHGWQRLPVSGST